MEDIGSDESEEEGEVTRTHSDGERRKGRNKSLEIPSCWSDGDEVEPTLREFMNELDPIDPSKPKHERDSILEDRIENLIRNTQNLTDQELQQRSILGHEADVEENLEDQQNFRRRLST